MGLTVGIVGLPNVGKSTLFNALTRGKALAANYPFATIEPNVGIAPLADARLEKLSTIFASEKIIFATVSFVDIAGLVEGASRGEGLGSKFLANIREVDAIAHVVRVFSDSQVVRAQDTLGPAADVDIVNTELALADMQTLEKVLAKKHPQPTSSQPDRVQLQKAYDALASNLVPEKISGLNLLRAKPVIYVINADQEVLSDTAARAQIESAFSPCVFLDAKFESDLAELDDKTALELRKLSGNESCLDTFVAASFSALQLQTFFTAGPKEARAWTIKQLTKAPQAAGVIHSDFEKKFIRAEIISCTDLFECGSMNAARALGKVRLEGRDYVMHDGDVVEFRHAA
ncbi:redox-regulated ATPase YchF [Tropheryma whipplei]|uniref:redox-regulated ATPase YchF n=1 Tax=Tropheryma whipplei TaxID=2039 RepID=UPI0004B3FF8E|nr:redox-regulated ATPase YchF [Tropheryma whipplei]